jgi:hypothetical protein
MSRKVFTEMNTDLKGWQLSIQYLEPLQGDAGQGRTLKAGVTKTWKKKKD